MGAVRALTTPRPIGEAARRGSLIAYDPSFDIGLAGFGAQAATGPPE